MPEPLPETLARALDRLVATAQSEQRIPSVTAAVFRDGEVAWSRALGLADVARREEATVDHCYRIGSITKTFTAVALMQLRDAGRLELDAPLRSMLPEFPPGPTIRQALSHLTGMQREPPGEIWETMRAPDREQLVGGLEDAERVLRPGQSWHYSNLVFALLGEVIARTTGSYEATLRQHVLDPLGLDRTRLRPEVPAATPYFVDPWSDGASVEPDPQASESIAAAGWLWSTVGDLARWADFLATGNDDVLARATLDEMARVQTMVDEEGWTLGWGLGLELYRRGEHVLVGHGGAMPGFLAGVCVSRSTRTGAAVLANTGAGAYVERLAVDLAACSLDDWPRAPEPWTPGERAPADVVALLGSWWSEGSELQMTWSDGRLALRLLGGVKGRDTSWLVREDVDRWRVEEGRERGELVRVVRSGDGSVAKLYFATYPVTRTPTAFSDDVSE